MSANLSAIDWQLRFEQQARWTRDLRAFLYPKVGIPKAKRILDLGCGTGALLGELISQSEGQVHGIDLKHQHLVVAQEKKQALLSQGDAHVLPIASQSVNICLCHFFIMWVNDPAKVIEEMKRVTSPGGAVLALAEPDYGGRIDYPRDLEKIGQWQMDALRNQGADPLLGRKLSALFHKAELKNVETGVLGGQWKTTPSPDELDMEWTVLESDLEETSQDSATWEVLIEINRKAWANGERVLFVPTFYALGWVD